MGLKALKVTISIVAITLIAVHAFFPNVKIDAISLALLVLLIVPWLAPLIKSFELPGGYKIEFQEVQQVEVAAISAGMVAPDEDNSNATSTYEPIGDPILRLAGLRIDFEREARRILEDQNGTISDRTLSGMFRQMRGLGIITNSQAAALTGLIYTLNRAVHGVAIDQEAAREAYEVGQNMLVALRSLTRTAQLHSP